MPKMSDYMTEEKISRALTRLANLLKKGDNRLWVDDSGCLYLCRDQGDRLLVVDSYPQLPIDAGQATIVESSGIEYILINGG